MGNVCGVVPHHMWSVIILKKLMLMDACYVCMCAHSCVLTCVHTYTGMWKPEKDFGSHSFSDNVHLVSETGSLSLAPIP